MGERERNETYLETARKLIEAIKTHLIVRVGVRTFLLPGAEGFVFDDRIRLNPSYLLIPIYRRIARFDPSPLWESLIEDAWWLLKEARFTPFMLHPDWIDLRRDNGAPIRQSAVRFGYDAIRVPLMLTQTKKGRSLLEGYIRYVKSMTAGSTIFGTVDLQKGLIDMKNHSLAFHAVYEKIAQYAGLSFPFRKKFDKRVNENDYYGYAIYLLAHP
jgi:endoglucanase